MITLEVLLALPGAMFDDAVELVQADRTDRRQVTKYQGLTDLEAVSNDDGARIFLRRDEVSLVYVGRQALSDEIDHDALVEALGTEGRELRSRQGKAALLHVVADRGIAWSEEDGEIGFVELFPPSTFEEYEDEIYVEPPPFRR